MPGERRRFARGAQGMRRGRGAGLSLSRSESVGDSRGNAAETRRRGRDACVSYNCIGWSGETADAGDLKSLGAIRTGSNPVFSMRSLSSAAGFFFCVPNTIMGDFGTQARIIGRDERPPCAFLDAAQGNDLRRRFDRLDRRATKAVRDCGAWPRRATALCVPQCRSGK